MHDSNPASRVLVFDSGLGALTVLREVAKARPDAELALVADDAGFPYGKLDDKALVDRVVAVLDRYIALLNPSLVVIACNTASTLALPVVRGRFAIPFVGTVPAIKPACAQSKTKRVSVLATPATVRRDYTHQLVDEFAHGCKVTLVGGEMLASLAEAVLRGAAIDEEEVRREIAPCFVDDDVRTDTVVLACTHYPLILDRLMRLAPWPVTWLDPAPAIARRVAELLGPAQGGAARGPQAYFTSGSMGSEALSKSLAAFGVEIASGQAIPLAV
ncbi:MAG TPA: glutamate racemase [Xanthobacteraceae bacterium]|nr:glutamate racemase [Xanthobacteraceae bacterium]